MDITTISIPYADRNIKVNIPQRNLMGVFTSNMVSIKETEEELINNSLQSPIGSPRISKLAQPGMSVVIIADDNTRPTPVSKILPCILNELHEAGVPDKSISLVFALGTHVPMTAIEMRERVGSDVANRIKLFNSEFKDPAGLKDCGTSPDGMHVVIDKRVAEADFKIAIGSIMPHPECGWGGGGKMIYPGVASEETVTTFHLSYVYVDWNTLCSDEAPVRMNMEKWIDTVGLDFIVNTVLTSDNRVYKVVAGHYIKAHRRGTAYGREIFAALMPEKADIVIINTFKQDFDFWMGSKSIWTGELALKNGGTMILMAPCLQGIGPHPEYADYIGCDNWNDLIEKAFSGMLSEPIAVSSGVALAKMRQRIDMFMVSEGLTREEVKIMQYAYYATAQEALDKALKKHGSEATVAVFPHGLNTLPIVNNNRK